MTEPAVERKLPTSRFLTTYREVAEEIREATGQSVYDGDPELANLVQGITMDRVIEAAVREYMERQQ